MCGETQRSIDVGVSSTQNKNNMFTANNDFENMAILGNRYISFIVVKGQNLRVGPILPI